MGHVQKRADKRWRARYLDPEGRERSKTFTRQTDALAFLKGVEGDMQRGAYVDPDAGKVLLRKYADEWLERQTFDESTREAVELRLRLHVYPTLGDKPLATVRPSVVQAWLRGLQQQLAPSYVRVIFSNLSAVLGAAVDDEKLSKNPCRAASVKVPRPDPNRVQPWSEEQMRAVRAALPTRYAILATLAAGLGLRQGEVFGLAVEDVDFLRGVVHIRRQVKLLSARPIFAAPKGRKVATCHYPSPWRSRSRRTWPRSPRCR